MKHKVIVKEGRVIKSKYFQTYAEAKHFYDTEESAIAFYPYNPKTHSIELVAVKNT